VAEPADRPDPTDEQPVRRAVAWGLIVLGWIWVVLAGGCTLSFLGWMSWTLLQDRLNRPDSASARYDAAWGPVLLIASVLVGGAGVLIGWLILNGGRALRQGRPRAALGWSLAVIGGLWSVQAALSLLFIPTQTSGGISAALPAVASLVPAVSIFAAGALILFGRPKRD
jgi:hypothetical protein